MASDRDDLASASVPPPPHQAARLRDGRGAPPRGAGCRHGGSGAAFHLWRGGLESQPTLIGLLRHPAYAERLADAPYQPPLPLLLMEVLVRGRTGTRDEEAKMIVEAEIPQMIDALEPNAATKRGGQGGGGQGGPAFASGARARAVLWVLQRIAKRLELLHKARQSEENARRKDAQRFTGKSLEDVAAFTMQRSAKRFLHGLHRRKMAAKQAFLEIAEGL